VIVENALGIKFIAHESTYRGGDYYCFGKIGEEEFTLQRNFNLIDKEWTEEEFQEFPILIYVDKTSRAEEIEKLLGARKVGGLLLKREQI
jgi:hypothetical protein